MLEFNETTRRIAEILLQSHINGVLKKPKDVRKIVLDNQPSYGLSNAEWNNICEFILEIEFANKNPVAQEVATRYGLTIVTN